MVKRDGEEEEEEKYNKEGKERKKTGKHVGIADSVTYVVIYAVLLLT